MNQKWSVFKAHDGTLTTAACAAFYLAEKGLKPHTVTTVRSRLGPVLAMFGERDVASLTAMDVEAFIEARVASGVKRITAVLSANTLVTAISFAVARGVLAGSALANSRGVKLAQTAMRTPPGVTLPKAETAPTHTEPETEPIEFEAVNIPYVPHTGPRIRPRKFMPGSKAARCASLHPLGHLERAFKPEALRILQQHEHTRPRTRGDCLPGGKNEARPCPFISCKFSTAISITDKGSVQIRFPAEGEAWSTDVIDWQSMRDSCALDVADRASPEEPTQLAEIAQHLNLAVAHIVETEGRALGRLRAKLRAHGIDSADGATEGGVDPLTGWPT